MVRNNCVVFSKGRLPITVNELCNLLDGEAELINVDSEAVISCLSFGLYYKPEEHDFLQICGSDDRGVVKRIHEGGTAALTDHVIEGIPCIIVKDLPFAVFTICKWLYQAVDLPSVVVSGSVGKTTLKRMTYTVLAERFRLFTINESRNTLKDLCCYIQNIEENDQFVVWEVSENRIHEVEYSSLVLQPRIAAITNIGESHIGTIEGGKEALLQSIQSITAGMDKEGVVIINADDRDSRQICFDRKTIRVSLKDTAADCFAYNISKTKKGVSFDLRFEEHITHVDLSVFGVHNIYNAMMAFVIGVLQGIDRKTAARALKKYRNVGFRQNILRFGGVVVYADCYNSSALSVSSAIRCFCDLPGIHGKRIAVLGDIAEIEGHEEQTYRKIAEVIDDSAIDMVVTYGKDSAAIHDYLSRPVEKLHCSSSAELDAALNQLKRSGTNAYLIKGSRSMKMEQNLRHCFPWHYYPMRAVEKLTIKYKWGE